MRFNFVASQIYPSDNLSYGLDKFACQTGKTGFEEEEKLTPLLCCVGPSNFDLMGVCAVHCVCD